MPPARLLPAPVRPLAELNAAFVRPETADEDVDDLVAALPQPVRQNTPRPPARRPLRLAVGAVGAAVVVGAIALISRIGLPGASSPEPGSPPPITAASSPPPITADAVAADCTLGAGEYLVVAPGGTLRYTTGYDNAIDVTLRRS